MSQIFVISNVLITLGYTYIAFALVPILPVRRLAKLGGVAFFLLCGLTHLDMVYHALWASREPFGDLADDLHMFLIHAPQAVAIWVFAVGFVRDMQALQRERRTTRPAHD